MAELEREWGGWWFRCQEDDHDDNREVGLYPQDPIHYSKCQQSEGLE